MSGTSIEVPDIVLTGRTSIQFHSYTLVNGMPKIVLIASG